ncbi:hypothetical protein LCGC14_2139070 [marine sediment metagenome]|uniref:Uncharacterized protein n=1 Tax=marine sediment metagenome TaxID=412755 RepID=A0A0F9GV91_9ZZZZ
MPIYICPYCSARTALTDDQRGTTIECPHCQMDGVAYGVSVVEDPAERQARVVMGGLAWRGLVTDSLHRNAPG